MQNEPVALRRVPPVSRCAMAVLGVAVALCALYANLAFAVRDTAAYRFFPPFLPHVNANGSWGLGGEYFNIARALAAGDGYAHPFGSRTGPTAWQPPPLPTFLAALLWLSHGSRSFVVVIVLCLNSVVLIGTGWLVLRLAGQTTARVGIRTATVIFLLALLSQFHQCFQRAHDGWLVLLSLDGIIAGLCWWRPLEGAPNRACVAWGLFGGWCALVSPVVGLSWGALSVLVGRRPATWSPLALALLVAGLTLVPWTIRNYLVFGRLIPVKSNLFFEAYQAQCLQPDGLLLDFTGHPGSAQHAGGQAYRTLGETAFLERKREGFCQAVRLDPVDFLDRVGHRFLAATLWYVPFHGDHGRPPPLLLWLKRLTHPLPFLALLVLLYTAAHRPLTAPQRLVIGLYGLQLAPYVLISYYERYASPLLVVKALLLIWASDRLLGVFGRRPSARYPACLCQERTAAR